MSPHPFTAARDFLVANRTDYEAAVRGFRWPSMETFNWGFDYFDVIAAGNTQPVLAAELKRPGTSARPFVFLCGYELGRSVRR